MPRSFQIVEEKVVESEFFLDKLHYSGADLHTLDFQAARFYLSAFLSALRSVTFCLQASLSDVPDFTAWYDHVQQQLRDSELAQFFLDARNLSQKVGYYPLAGGSVQKSHDQSYEVNLYFDNQSQDMPRHVPNLTVLDACEAQFRQILLILVDCYRKFGTIIDPEQYYTPENMAARELTIEDFEEELGLPRGWTQADGITVADRVALIRRSVPGVEIDWVFEKHLGTNRYGDILEQHR